MQIINCEQGTEEWYQARLGKVTASNFAKVLSKGETRKTYMLQLVAERLTGEKQDTYTNAAMEWGTEHEPQARATHEFVKDIEVKEIGFCLLNDDVGYSPDGFIGDNGLAEYKCPNTTTHLNWVLAGRLPAKHKAQVQGGMWITEREYCDFVSFDPRITGTANLFICRVERDEEYIKTLAESVDKFVAELHAMLTKLEAA
jgi:putative phage-type endonuclease